MTLVQQLPYIVSMFLVCRLSTVPQLYFRTESWENCGSFHDRRLWHMLLVSWPEGTNQQLQRGSTGPQSAQHGACRGVLSRAWLQLPNRTVWSWVRTWHVPLLWASGWSWGSPRKTHWAVWLHFWQVNVCYCSIENEILINEKVINGSILLSSC